jgi:hypothetical protein
VQHNPSAAKEAVALGGLQDLSGAARRSGASCVAHGSMDWFNEKIFIFF